MSLYDLVVGLTFHKKLETNFSFNYGTQKKIQSLNYTYVNMYVDQNVHL